MDTAALAFACLERALRRERHAGLDVQKNKIIVLGWNWDLLAGVDRAEFTVRTINTRVEIAFSANHTGLVVGLLLITLLWLLVIAFSDALATGNVWMGPLFWLPFGGSYLLSRSRLRGFLKRVTLDVARSS